MLRAESSIYHEFVWQVTSPVQWASIMDKVVTNEEFEQGVELGPGRVLAGIMRRVDKKAKVDNVEV